ncbi:MAG TPA: transketolase [Alphaproteobacteria bacterium]|nr:transketolase [Alphaproteobacteria bacterium]
MALEAAPVSKVAHDKLANALRFLAVDAVEKANSGHPGLPMGMADVATVLYSRFLKFDPSNPSWPDRDRFVLSAGHGSMLLYALNYLTGYKAMGLDDLKLFRQTGSRTPGHPEHDIEAGIETTTGPLGQGLATSIGMAIAEAHLESRFEGLIDHFTYVIASDGDLEEAVSHEASSLAGHLSLGKLIVFYDDNGISIDGHTSLAFSDDTPARFAAYGWHVQRIDGHNTSAIAAAIAAAQADPRPSIICCKTIIGFGSPNRQGTHEAHSNAFGPEEIAATRENLNWPYAPFEIPDEIMNEWRRFGARGQPVRKEWDETLKSVSAHKQDEFAKAMKGDLPAAAVEALTALKKDAVTSKPKLATRQSSGKVLEAIFGQFPELMGGSADLTPSNNTKVKGFPEVARGSFGGRYIHYGIREFGMCAAMNGMSLHGGVVPYGGTFMCFSDYARPAIRLASLMKQRVVFVMTHDSIGLGEDGPTHQPVEHLAALRAIPHLLTMRPADLIETAECWELALQHQDRPSLLALSRQGVPALREDCDTNKSAKGAYVLDKADGPEQVRIFATGTEVYLARDARAQLKAKGINATVVSVPCFNLFFEQDDAYRAEIIGGKDVVKVGIEAAVRFGWDSLIGQDGIFVGMKGFGDSGPAPELYKHFNITAEAVTEAVSKRLQR